MIYPVNEENLRRGAEILRSGGLAAFPTETVYGLGADAFNAEAVAKIFAVKQRPRFDPLIVHIAGIDGLGRAADLALLAVPLREKAETLARQFWPGPLTLVLPRRPEVPAIVSSGLSTVAIRLPDHSAARDLIRVSQTAIAAPSANLFGRLSPTTAAHVREQLGDRLDFILDGGPCRVGVESTVLQVCDPVPRILRPGGVTKEMIEAVIGPVEIVTESTLPASPGQLKSHYAPRRPLILHERGTIPPCPGPDDKAAYLFYDGASRDKWLEASGIETLPPGLPEKGLLRERLFVLSEGGNSAEAAGRLFELLHRADELDIETIHAERACEEGLGQAINDRLSRAAAT